MTVAYNECAVAYAAVKESIKKFCKENSIRPAFDERYPYTASYSVEQAATLFDEQDENADALRIVVTVGVETFVKIESRGCIFERTLRKLIKGTENAADLFFRAKAEGSR